ncbi:MAG: hypothetical protein SCARUB_03739 [Candidatus Scalindua rubra]|uniref:Uncharacterized protein n=1 Tax=Candidatus Scalindua rubra TaxID=1872076 RepID=A0A1E3X6B5_9BACT|nr:MAG: hypothetical protein SCARUB_03739 [Candidatus Scalindua rubra]
MLGIEDFIEIGKNFGISTQAVTNILTELENRYPESSALKKELDSVKCIM